MKVFLSHTTADRPLADFVAKELAERRFTVLRPTEELAAGEKVSAGLTRALDQANAMVVLFSETAATSESVRQEVSFALGSKRYAQRVVPILIGRPRGVPWILRDLNSYRFEGDKRRLIKAITKALSAKSLQQKAGAAK